ncbi:MAG: GspH/FimT family pseudopilin [Halothiobacillaceae bacterium]
MKLMKALPRPPKSMISRGFTLIEVMVVMVIIAILVTAVGLSLKGDRAGEALGDEAKRLSALLNLAREEAVMRDRDLGLVLNHDGYFFVQRDEEQAEDDVEFIPLSDDAMFRVRALPPGTELEFEARANAASSLRAPSSTTQALAPRVQALANDMFWPQGVLILRNPATPRVERIVIEQDGARILPDASEARP